MQINTLASQAAGAAKKAVAGQSAGTGFASALSSELAQPKAAFKADVVSGRIGVDVNKFGFPHKVSFFDESGRKIGSTVFNAPSMLRQMEKLGIDKEDLNGLADQLDAAGIKYKPYEMLQSAKSDRGIDLRDLASGGLGTAYDWRVDSNVALKGKGAAARQETYAALADRWGIVANPAVTGAAPPKSETPVVASWDNTTNYNASTAAMSSLRDQQAAANASRAALLALTQSFAG